MPISRAHLVISATLAVGIAACNAPAPPTLAPIHPTPQPSAGTGPTDFSTTSFAVPFTITIPSGWRAGDQTADMLALGLAGNAENIGIDIQLVPKVYADPCADRSGATDPAGSSAADLAAWMLAWAPLAAASSAPVTIAGQHALVVDEAFAGMPCQNANLWPTSGGWLDAAEHKRYFIFEASGNRFVATIVSPDSTFASQVDTGLAVLGTLTFRP